MKKLLLMTVAAFMLMALECTQDSIESIAVGFQTGAFITGVSGTATFTVTTRAIPDGAVGTISWYSSQQGAQIETPHWVTSATITPISKNKGMVTITKHETEGWVSTHYIAVTIGETVSNRAKVSLTQPTIHVSKVTIISTNLTVNVGESITLEVDVLPENAQNKKVSWSSDDPYIASAAPGNSGEIFGISAGTVRIRATSNSDTNVRDFVYVTVVGENTYGGWGVPIGNTTWATRNVDSFGTFAVHPYDPGKLYQWNNPKAWPATGNPAVGWIPFDNSSLIWEPENDPCPEGWRIPTYLEKKELVASGHEKTPLGFYGVRGRTFGAYPYTVFFPVVNIRDHVDGSLFEYVDNSNEHGYYWTSDVFTEYGEGYSEMYLSMAHILLFHDYGVEEGGLYDGYIKGAALPIRCVKK